MIEKLEFGLSYFFKTRFQNSFQEKYDSLFRGYRAFLDASFDSSFGKIGNCIVAVDLFNYLSVDLIGLNS